MRHSWLRLPGLLGAVVIMLALVAPAQADVDWSAYIDHSAPARTAPAQTTKAPRAKTVKRSNKKIAKAKKAKAKVKARSKSKTKSKTRRK